MPIIVTKDSTDYYLVPAPLVSFTRNTYSNIGRPQFGADFNITLEGTLVPEKGNPFFDMTSAGNDAQLSTASWTKPSGVANAGAGNEPNYGYDEDELLASTLRKQEKIRSLFSNPIVDGVAKPIIINITNWGETTKGFKFAAFVNEITFDSASRGVSPGGYTINLTFDSFLNSANDDEFGVSNDELNAKYSITSVTETFDISEDNRVNLTFAGQGVNTVLDQVNKIYAIARSTTVVGAPRYDADGAYVSGAPWQQASGYLYETLGLGSGIVPTGRQTFLSNLGDNNYKIADRVITENIDQDQGSYSITENYIAYSGDPVIHTISVDANTEQNERNQVSVQGTIQGLNTLGPFETTKNNFVNASGFNVKANPSGDSIPSGYFYGKSLSELNWLNPIPVSKTISRNIEGGVITYSYTFDDRPPNLVSGSVLETIAINNTYPGELYSATPVIGRNQPVLQYLNSRSEYKRSLNINITMGSTENNWSYDDAPSGYWNGATQSNIQKWLITDNPTNNPISSGDLDKIFQAVNPVNDPNFTVRNGKCFHSAPVGNWDAYGRTYSYSIEWTYEREV